MASSSWALDPQQRFLLVHAAEWEDAFKMKQALLEHLRVLYGSLGQGMQCDVVGWQGASRTAIVHTSRPHFHYLWAAMTSAGVRVIRVAATLMALSHSSEHDISII